MSERVEAAGVELAYVAEGEGPAVVTVHDMGDARMELGDRVAGRRIAYQRRGYGDSSAPAPYTATTVEEQAEDLVALLRALDATPALLVGDGFGGLVVLAGLRRHGSPARAAVVAAPPLLAFVDGGTEELSRRRAALEEELRAGAPADRAALADFAGLASWPGTRRDLRSISVPVRVVTRPGAAGRTAAAPGVPAALGRAAERRDAGDPPAAVRALSGA